MIAGVRWVSDPFVPKRAVTGSRRGDLSRKKFRNRPITCSVEYGVWTFSRGGDRLEISRKDLDDGVVLVIAGDGTPRSYFFREARRLETFQKDMETLLLKTGWS